MCRHLHGVIVMFSRAKLALLLLFTGCSVGEVPGGGTPDGGGGGMNQMTFASMITPLVTECTGCHGGTMPNLMSFAVLDAKYKMKPGANNILVTKGAISVPVNMHQGVPYFSDAEKATVAAWIDGLTP